MKTFDVPVSGAIIQAIPTAGTGMTGWLLNDVVQGTTDAQRIGSKIVIRSIEVKALIEYKDATTTPDESVVRIVIWRDAQPNGLAVKVEDVFREQDTSVPFLSSMNIKNKSRFSIIRDALIPVGTSGPASAVYRQFIRGRWEVEYLGTAGGGTIADISTGAIYLSVFGFDNDTTPLYPYFSFCARIRYED